MTKTVIALTAQALIAACMLTALWLKNYDLVLLDSAALALSMNIKTRA